MEMDDDRLKFMEGETIIAIEFHRKKGNFDTRQKCEGILAEMREEMERRKNGGPPT
jgi:hypothetical protein